MSIDNMLVSFVGSQITVKIPAADVPADGSPVPFTMTPGIWPLNVLPLTGMTLGPEVDGYRTYTIPVESANAYVIRTTGTINQSGTQTSISYSTGIIQQGDSFQLQPHPMGDGSYLEFKNLDSVAPSLVSISRLSDSGISFQPPVEPEGSTPKAYFVAKFSEGVTGVSNQSFNVTSIVGGVSSTPQNVQSLWLNGTAWSTVPPLATAGTTASNYLVTVNVASEYQSYNTNVTLNSPPTILSVQKMDAMPVDTGSNSIGTPTGNVSWLKVNLEANADQQFLTQAGGTPRLAYTFAAEEYYGVRTTEVAPNYAVQGTNPKVIYLGFDSANSAQTVLTEAPTSIAFKTNSGPMIKDSAYNYLGTSTTAQYLDVAGEPVFSKWGGDTTTISDASVKGYANGASFGTAAYKANEPSYYTDGKPLGKDSNGNPTYEDDVPPWIQAKGDRIGMDTIDLSGIKSGPIIINANKGEAYVYVDGKAAILDVDDYDRYILNDRFKGTDGKFVLGNEFYGTVDSEYVVVGSGGDNYLVAGNQGATDISSSVLVKNYQFNSTGIVRETDIVDYSQLATGITVNLGYSAKAAVSVVYKDGTTQADTLFGFEGVVGSRGNDNISGSNVGNALAGGAGNDELSGYHTPVAFFTTGDALYDPYYLSAEYGKGTANYKAAQFLVDSSDILYGGAGADKLYGGAGRDMLIDLGKAEMWGSDKTGFSGNGTVGLRDSTNKNLAENDVFWVRGDSAETATINNFHLSKDGTGLAGRSNSANDAIMFSIDTTKLFFDPWVTTMQRMIMSNDYNEVYSRLSFEQKVVNTDDIELVVNFNKYDGSSIKVGSTIIADMGSMLNGGANRAEVVELKWLAKVDDPLYLFNPKIDVDLVDFIEHEEFGNSLNIAIALELQKAGTVRGTNEFGVMAAKLSDNNLDERVYNPGDKDDRILGTANNDSYDFVVQKFNENSIIEVGKDAIFDIGGTKDVLTFEGAAIDKLKFSAVSVGRESHANSLRVSYEQTAALDGDSTVTNKGEVTWQGHFQEGGRQAAETLQAAGRDYAVAQAVYEYDSKGYVKGGPKITADNARDVIMVGQGAGDKFVFDFNPDAVRVGTSAQSARIAGFDSADRIDISDYVTQYGSATASMVDGKARVDFADATGFGTFRLELTFQDFSPATDDALRLALYG